MSATLVTDKEIENFTLTVIQTELLIQTNCIRINYKSKRECFNLKSPSKIITCLTRATIFTISIMLEVSGG